MLKRGWLCVPKRQASGYFSSLMPAIELINSACPVAKKTCQLVSELVVPAVLAVASFFDLCMSGRAIPDDPWGPVGCALPALGKTCQRIVTKDAINRQSLGRTHRE